jgi:glutathionyl-hydroquinone reductase
MEETKKQKEGHEEGKTEYRRQKKTCKRNTEKKKQKKNQTRKYERETMQRSLRTKWASKSFLHRILKLLNLRIPKPETANGKLSLAKHLT